MTEFAFIFLLFLASVLAEVIAGSYGLLIPLAGFAIFYLSITYGWKTAVFLGIFAGFSVDFLFSRNFLLNSVLYPFIPFFAVFWKKNGSLKTYFTQFVPGIFISVFISFSVLLWFLTEKTRTVSEFVFLLSQMILAAVIGIFFFPASVFVLDKISAFLEISRYKESKPTTEINRFQK